MRGGFNNCRITCHHDEAGWGIWDFRLKVRRSLVGSNQHDPIFGPFPAPMESKPCEKTQENAGRIEFRAVDVKAFPGQIIPARSS
ncbi:MAG: hypothetical protein CMJ62_07070 [Planctomycetaceae bacterium]|nr:hypothetical protein [Planctomycetaceae bacterium]